MTAARVLVASAMGTSLLRAKQHLGTFAAVVAATSVPSAVGADGPSAYTPARLPATERAADTRAALSRASRGVPLLVSQTSEASLPGDRRARVNLTFDTPGVGDSLDYTALWQADLVLGAVADLVGQSEVANQNAVGQVSLRLPGGTLTAPQPLEAGVVQSRQAFADDTLSEVSQRVKSIAGSCGLSVEDVALARGISAAPMVTLSAGQPSDLSHCPNLLGMLFEDGDGIQRYEGYFLQINSPGRGAVVRLTASFRVGRSASWGGLNWVGPLGITRGAPRPPGISRFGVAFGSVTAGLRPRGYSLRVRVRVPRARSFTVVVRQGQRVLGHSRSTSLRAGWRVVDVNTAQGLSVEGGRASIEIAVRGRDHLRRQFGGGVGLRVAIKARR